MKGTEKQIQLANDLLDKMHKEFVECKKIAPENVHDMFDSIENILKDSYAGDVIELLIDNKNEGQKYFGNFKAALHVSANIAAMKIKKSL